ncbi:zinc protease [Mesorhizobium sp. J18]|uniref:M16 family metallopeptidase n=1 Tax=Mesorhizobium sp. J18 TaxID=935263 RepID=UPI0011992653|nr:pitrilysin family protein [Mesorhizobium sp. J18]TWG97447.1 zinc protease [Mesorhizobium sp. J18]
MRSGRTMQSNAMARILSLSTILALAFFFLALPAIMPARAAVEIQEVTSQKGITAWLVEDHTIPIVTIRFAFEGGSTQDPAGKEGIANLMTGLFDEGAGDLESAKFQQALDVAGAEMSFSASRDAIYGSMRLLAENQREALDLLRLAINEPRFDQPPIDRIRSQIKSRLLSQSRDPQYEAQREFAKALYGEHPYARPDQGTAETLDSITEEDLKAFHDRLFARGRLHVAVVGAIGPEDLKRELDALFGDLPEEPDLLPVEHVAPRLDQRIPIAYDLPQSTIHVVYPGVSRKDSEFFPAYLMNEILGGGTFSSRLFEEVREKRGLAYGVGSDLISRKYSEALMIGTATRPDRANEALKIILDEARRMAAEGPTQEELDAAKRYVIGAYAINNLDSSSVIARTLVNLQIEDLGIDYIDRRVELINAVTRDQVLAAAQRLLQAEPAIMILGPEPQE